MSIQPASGGVPLPAGYVRSDAGRVQAAPLMSIHGFNEHVTHARDLMGSAHLHLARTIGDRAERAEAMDAITRALRLDELPREVRSMRAQPDGNALRLAYTDFHRSVGQVLFDPELRIGVPGLPDSMLSARASVSEVLEWLPAIEQAFKGQAELWAAGTGDEPARFLQYQQPGLRYVPGDKGSGHLRIGGHDAGDLGGLARDLVQRAGAGQRASGAATQQVFQQGGMRLKLDPGQRAQVLGSLERGAELLNAVLEGPRLMRFAKMAR